MYRWGLTLSFASLALMLESSFVGVVLAGIAGYLLGGLIDRNRRNQKMYQLWTAAMESPEGVHALIESGANLKGHDRHTGWTILHRTASANSPESTRALIEAGANIVARDANERTLLHHAALNNATETARILIRSGANLHARIWTCARRNWTMPFPLRRRISRRALRSRAHSDRRSPAGNQGGGGKKRFWSRGESGYGRRQGRSGGFDTKARAASPSRKRVIRAPLLIGSEAPSGATNFPWNGRIGQSSGASACKRGIPSFRSNRGMAR